MARLRHLQTQADPGTCWIPCTTDHFSRRAALTVRSCAYISHNGKQGAACRYLLYSLVAEPTDSLQPSPVSPIRDSERVPESPTTARALDFDDEEQKTGTIKMTDSLPSSAAHTTPAQALPAATTEVPPPKPPRPIDPRVQAEATLKEAFPGIDLSVIKAVLAASGGQVEPAFNALLGMSDPDAQQREMPPPQPPRPAARQTQLESDEMYARQLAEHYETTARAQQQQRQPSYGQAPRRQERPLPQAPQRNFIDGKHKCNLLVNIS